MNQFNADKRKQGIALIVVLSILSILITLVLAFFAMVQTERQASGSFAESIEVRNLSEIPVNLVISQIRKATENNAPSGTNTQFKTWASQPGMIRVFGTEPDESQVRSKPTSLYKLYSDETMVLGSSGASSQSGGMGKNQVLNGIQSDVSDLSSWNTKPGLFVDLNEPVPVPGTTPTYKFPIVDPKASTTGDGAQAVDGFKYTTSTVTGTIAAANRSDIKARLPMPVRWLYLLRDGSLIAPTGGNETTTTFVASGSTQAPTADNPIVGRVAFWTDDDSNKINLNTASEGSHWDTPIANNPIDREYARYVPAQNEFSRYPGHPAATSLSPVFQAISESFYVNPYSKTSDYKTAFERLHKISPRVPWGGTQAGTQDTGTNNAGLPAKQERLYASVEEVFLNPERNLNMPELNANALELSKFFLTTQSRSPELNLFGKPRINLWPISNNKSHRNPKDKLLAFMSETMSSDALSTKAFYFQRKQNFSSQATPGSSQDPTSDYSVGRNQDMIQKYIPYLMGQSDLDVTYTIPGFANSTGGNQNTFYTKYRGTNKLNQIIVEMFDLLRWGVNGYSTVSKSGWPTYTYLPDRVDGNRGQSTSVPIVVNKDNSSSGPWLGRGFGRWPTVTEATVIFIRTKAATENSGGFMRPFLVLEGFNPTTGPPSQTANIIYRIEGLQKWEVKFKKADGSALGNFQNLGFKVPADNRCTITGGDNGSTSFASLYNSIAGKTAQEPYPFVGRDLEIPKDAKGFDFIQEKIHASGNSYGLIRIKIAPNWKPDFADNPLVQTIELEFPIVTNLPLPRLASGKTEQDVYSRFTAGSSADQMKTLILDGDITRSVEPNVAAAPKGDLRFYSAMPFVPRGWFTTHPLYSSPTQERLHFLRNGKTTESGQYGPPFAIASPGGTGDVVTLPNFPAGNSNRTSTSDTAGTLLRNFTYSKRNPPAVPRGLNGAMQQTVTGDFRPGDWDNGVGMNEDGPYIKKPDEGNASFSGGTPSAQASTYMLRHFYDKDAGASYSPQRQITSAIAFGSLPTGIDYTYTGSTMNLNDSYQRPWRTLLFCPNPASRTTPPGSEPVEADHVGFRGPRDHLILDMFWMPATEPYAISEPLSTAGKINMNYQMVPFTHIDRSTGLRAVLKSARVTAIPPSSGGGDGLSNPAAYNMTDTYKRENVDGTVHAAEFRYAVNADLTLDGFKKRFQSGDIFRSASEICEIFLVPKRLIGSNYLGARPEPNSYDQMTEWWNGNLNQNDAFELTGDNTREAPYSHVYPRLTTRSNTYTVHYRVQTLKKSRSTAPDQWEETKDVVTAEYRGSTTLERYLDPNDAELSGLSIGSNHFKDSWDPYYRIRIIQRKQFVP